MAELNRLEIQIETSAKQASSQLDLVMEKLEKISNSLNGLNTSKLANLGKSFDVVSKSTDTASKSVGNVSSRLQSMNGVMNKSVNATRSLSSAFGTFYANCYMIIRGFKKLNSAVEASMDYIETYNYFNVIADKIGAEFGSAWKENGASSAEDYVDSFRDRLNSLTSQMTGYTIGGEGGLYLSDNVGLGLDPEKIMAYQANISSITNAVGLMGETSVNTSKALTMLAADLSSLKNQDLENIMKNLQSGLIGQSRALYKYGIDITNNTLQTYAYANGIDKAVSAMTQAEKMQLRLLAILDQSKVAYGDMANTISGVANQFRIFKQQMSNLARTIGNLFIPVLQAVLPYINGFVIALQRLFTWIGSLLGVKWDKLMDGISSGYTDTGLEALEDNADDVTDALDGANSAAKKLKNNLQDWHEINNITTQESSSSGGGSVGGGGIDLSNAIAGALADYEKVWNEALAGMENKAQEIADKICDIFKNHDFRAVGEYIGNGITNALESIDWEKVYAVANSFGSGLAEFFNGLISPELFSAVGKTIAGVLSTAIYTALSFATTFDWTNLGLSIASGVNTFFETFDFAALAQAINAWVQGLFKALTTAIANIDWSNVWNGIKTFFENLDIETVGIIIGALVIKKILGLHLVSAALDMIGSAISKSLAGAIGSKLGLNLAKDAGLGATFAGIGKQMGTTFMLGFKALLSGSRESGAVAKMLPTAGISSIIGTITGIASVIGGAALAVTNFFSMWKDGFSWLKEILMVIGVAIAAVGAVILGVPAGIAAIVAAIVAAVGTAAIVIHDNWDAICEWFSGIPEWFNTNVITPVCDFFEGLWESVSGFFSGLWEDIKGIWSKVSGWFNTNIITPLSKAFTEFKETAIKIFDGIWTGIKNGVVGAMNAVIGAIETAINWIVGAINGILGGFNKVVSWAARVAEVDWGGVDLVPEVHLNRISMYESGGFPNTGEMFMARENGITEMVGRIGNRPAVANNDQIVEGIAGAVYPAVYNAVLAAMGKNSESNGDIVVQIDGREVFRATQKRADEYYKRTGNPAFSY